MADERKVFEKQFHGLYNLCHAKKTAMKTKQAIFMNHQKIDIFRGDEFVKYLTSAEIKQLLPAEIQGKPVLVIVKYLIDNKIITRLDRHPDDPGKRWPKRLIPTRDQKLVDDGFYTWNIKVYTPMNTVKMGVILGIVFMILLYPIWPFTLKYFIFKLTLFLLVFLVGLLSVRLVVYVISRIFGCSFWILPNINDESQGILGCFKPLYSFYKFSDGIIEISLRIIAFIGVLVLLYILYQEPQYITGFQEASEQTIDDLLEWGKNTLERKAEPITSRMIPDLSDLMKQEEEIARNASEQKNDNL